MPACGICSSIPWNNLPSIPSYYWNGSPGWKYIHPFYEEQHPSVDDVPSYPYHPHIDSLKKSAMHCEICQLVLEAIENVMNELRTATEERCKAMNSFPGVLKYSLSLRKLKSELGGCGFWVFSNSDDPGVNYLVATIGFCVEEGSDLASQIRGRPIELDSGNDVSVARALSWVEECNSHPGCVRSMSRLPSRVLDVRNKNIRLVKTDGEFGTYVTLSHCWGASKKPTTTKATLSARETGIGFEDLPKTFQEVVSLVRRLGVPYLWIDSLCICQDDIEEWERESSRMSSVYSNAHLTIAATTASDSSEGLFRKRSLPRYTKIKYTSAERTDHEVLAFQLPLRKEALPHEYIDMEDEPLSQRGWCLQERVLARRTVHFGKHQMYFECNTGFKGENCLWLDHRYNAHKERANDLASVDYISDEDYKSILVREWESLLLCYTSRNLTRSSDKLPAISGLAKMYGERLNDKYVAGLWQNSLIDNLLWRTFGRGVTRTTEYRAPSWSWASCDGMITFNGPVNAIMGTIVGCEIGYKGLNPYGEVKSGSINLQAPLIELFINEEIDPDNTGVPYSKLPMVRTSTGRPRGAHCHFDFEFFSKTVEEIKAFVQSFSDTKIYGLVLGTTTDSYETLYQTLVVTPLNGQPSTMRRLGLLSQNELDMGSQEAFDPSFPRPIITLV